MGRPRLPLAARAPGSLHPYLAGPPCAPAPGPGADAARAAGGAGLAAPPGPINGGLPAQRNRLDIGDVLREVYVHRPGTCSDAQVPNDPELPLPLDQVRPIHEVVLIDYELPGCPPSADTFWAFFSDLLAGRTPRLAHGQIHYD